VTCGLRPLMSTVARAGLRNIPCDSVAKKSALIPMVSHAPPRMQRALAGAKRLECGSLLPLCSYVQQRVCPHIFTSTFSA